MEGNNAWNVATTNDQGYVKPPMKKQAAHLDNVSNYNYASNYNEQKNENVNKGYYSADNAKGYSSKISYTEGQSSYGDAQGYGLPSKRQHFNPSSYQPNYKRQNLGVRSTYLSDKRNQFNLTALKGDLTSDNKGTNNYQSASDPVSQPSSNTGTNYQWTPSNSSTNYQWTPNNQWDAPAINNFPGTPAHNQNIQASQEKNVSHNIHLNSTKDGILLGKLDSNQKSEAIFKDANFMSSIEGKFHTNQFQQGQGNAVDERIKQLYNETLKEKQSAGKDSNPLTMYGVDHKFGGKVKERGGKIFDKEPGIDERFGPPGGGRFEESREQKTGGSKQFYLHSEGSQVTNQNKFGNQNYPSTLNRDNDGMRQQSSLDGRGPINQYGQSASTLNNNPATRIQMPGENSESKTIEKDNNVSDKERIKQMLIDHANKSVLSYQKSSVNTFSSNAIRTFSNSNVSLKSVVNPATAAVNFTTNRNSTATVVKPTVNTGKPLVNSSVSSTTNTNSTANVVKSIANAASSTFKPQRVDAGKVSVKSVGNSAIKAVNSATNTNSTAKPSTNTVRVSGTAKILPADNIKSPMKSAVNSTTAAVSSTTNTNSTASVVKSIATTVSSTVNTQPVNTGKAPVKSAVNPTTKAVSSTTKINSNASGVKSIVNTGKPPVKSAVNSVTAAVSSTTNTNSTASVVKSTVNTVSSNVNVLCKPANADSKPSFLLSNPPMQIRPPVGIVAPRPAAGKYSVKSATNFNTMNTKSTANILKSALGTVSSNVNLFSKPVNVVRNPLYPVVNPHANAVIKPMNPALNPVINAALQYLPGAAVPLARANSPLLFRYNTMPASVFRHPMLNNITIAHNQGSPYYANQQLRQNILPSNIQSGQGVPPRSISKGRFRYS